MNGVQVQSATTIVHMCFNRICARGNPVSNRAKSVHSKATRSAADASVVREGIDMEEDRLMYRRLRCSFPDVACMQFFHHNDCALFINHQCDQALMRRKVVEKVHRCASVV